MGDRVHRGCARPRRSSTPPPRASGRHLHFSPVSSPAGSASARTSPGRFSPDRSSTSAWASAWPTPLSSPITRSTGESYFDQDASEWWGGLTASRALSDSLGVGLTWYGVYRGQRLRNELTFAGVGDGGHSLNALGVTDFDYDHYRMLAKLGLAWQGDTWKAGLAITTPSLSAFGGGKAARTLSLAGVDADQDGAPDPPTLAAGEAEDLDAYYKSSWAVGAGASRAFGPTRVYASAEWFAPVDRFTVIELPEEQRQRGASHPGAGQRAQRGRGLRTGHEPRRVGLWRFPHRLLGVRGKRHRQRRHIGLGPLPLQRGRLLPDQRQQLHRWACPGPRAESSACWTRRSRPRTSPRPIWPRRSTSSYSKLTFLLGFVFGR